MTDIITKLGMAFDGSKTSRYIEPEKTITATETLAVLLAYGSGQPPEDFTERAHDLIQASGGLSALLHAGTPFMQNEGLDAASITMLQAALAMQLHIISEKTKHTVISTMDQLGDYLHISFAHQKNECFKVFFLDRQNKLLADEIMGAGVPAHVPVQPRQVIKRALELEASALILVHNHPSGDPTPSQKDIDMTQDIVNLCEPLDIAVHDHVIIGHDYCMTSMRGSGLIKPSSLMPQEQAAPKPA